MYCKNCGIILEDNQTVCPACNTAVYEEAAQNTSQYTQYTPPVNNDYENYAYQSNDPFYQPPVEEFIHLSKKVENDYTLAILGLILGIVLNPLIGFIVGGITLSHAKSYPPYFHDKRVSSIVTISTFAIVIPAILLLLALIAVFFFVFVFATI